MCVCVYIYIYTYIYIYIYIYRGKYPDQKRMVYMYVSVCVYIYITWMCWEEFAIPCFLYTCIYTYIHTYIHTYRAGKCGCAERSLPFICSYAQDWGKFRCISMYVYVYVCTYVLDVWFVAMLKIGVDLDVSVCMYVCVYVCIICTYAQDWGEFRCISMYVCMCVWVQKKHQLILTCSYGAYSTCVYIHTHTQTCIHAVQNKADALSVWREDIDHIQIHRSHTNT